MTWFYLTVRSLLIAVFVITGSTKTNFSGNNADAQVPLPTPTTTVLIWPDPASVPMTLKVLTTPSTTVPPATTTTLALPDGKCSEWFRMAVDVGWPIDRLATLGNIMWAESRCDPTVWGTGAFGLTQIQYNAHSHWLKTQLNITERDDLYDPRINLRAALWLAVYADANYGCWAQPWYMSGDWC